jgi:hypothetical protein
MKRLALLAVVALFALGTAQAQGWGPETIRIDGTLGLQNGQIVLSNNTVVYSIPAITRYLGFIEGLKEGAAVTVEGYAYGLVLTPVKLTVGGRAYDFPNAFYAGYGGGCGGCGGYGPADRGGFFGRMRRR